MPTKVIAKVRTGWEWIDSPLGRVRRPRVPRGLACKELAEECAGCVCEVRGPAELLDQLSPSAEVLERREVVELVTRDDETLRAMGLRITTTRPEPPAVPEKPSAAATSATPATKRKRSGGGDCRACGGE